MLCVCEVICVCGIYQKLGKEMGMGMDECYCLLICSLAFQTVKVSLDLVYYRNIIKVIYSIFGGSFIRKLGGIVSKIKSNGAKKKNKGACCNSCITLLLMPEEAPAHTCQAIPVAVLWSKNCQRGYCIWHLPKKHKGIKSSDLQKLKDSGDEQYHKH